MKPLVSIITPCYNARPFLPATWRSIKNQTFKDWEWIVWEDGSNDGSAEWLKALAAKDSRVKVLSGERTKNAGAGRNRGAKSSNAAFLAFLDADDLWHPEKLRRQIELMNSYPKVDVTYVWMKEFFWSENGVSYPAARTWPRHELIPDPVAQLLKFGNPASPSTLLIRRPRFEELGGFKTDLGGVEDFEFFSRAVERCTIKRTPGVLAAYRIHQQNMTQSLSKSFLPHERLFAYLEKGQLLNKAGGSDFRSIYFTRRAESAMEGVVADNPKTCFLKAFYWNPRSPKRWIPLLLLPIPNRFLLSAYINLKKLQTLIFSNKTAIHRFSTQHKNTGAKNS